ncbi:MAG: hypothetical protein ABEK04_02600 [Candidatus Nanohalobium sp.]
MVEFELDDLAESKRFWTLVIGFIALSGLVQLALGNFLLAITSLGAGVTFAILAHEELKDEEA